MCQGGRRVRPSNEELVKWAAAHGARTPGLRIQPDEAGERGVVAPEDLAPRSDILRVPRALLTTDADARVRYWPLRAAIRSEATKIDGLRLHERVELQLILFIVLDRARVDREEAGVAEEDDDVRPPPWLCRQFEGDEDALDDVLPIAPWYASAPQAFEQTPMSWPDEALEALLPPSRVATAHAQRAECDALRSLLRSVAPNALRKAEHAWSRAGRWADPCVWAYAAVRSRAFSIVIQGKNRAALVPLADLLNHAAESEVNADWKFDDASGTQGEFIMRASKSVASGAQLFDRCAVAVPSASVYRVRVARVMRVYTYNHACSCNICAYNHAWVPLCSYGPKTNGELLLHYGFVLPVDASTGSMRDAMLPLALSACSPTAEVRDEGLTARRAAHFVAAAGDAAGDCRVLLQLHAPKMDGSPDAGMVHALALMRAAVASAVELDDVDLDATPEVLSAFAAAATVRAREHGWAAANEHTTEPIPKLPILAPGFVEAGHGLASCVSAPAEMRAACALRDAIARVLASLPTPLEVAGTGAAAEAQEAAKASVTAGAREAARAVLECERSVLTALVRSCDEAIAALVSISQAHPSVCWGSSTQRS